MFVDRNNRYGLTAARRHKALGRRRRRQSTFTRISSFRPRQKKRVPMSILPKCRSHISPMPQQKR